MPLAAAGISAAGGLLGGITGGKGATRAAQIQADAAKAGIAEQQRQFDTIQTNEQPYMAAGNAGLGAYLNLLGIGQGGANAQQSAIDQLKASPGFTALDRSSTDAILQNAAATGGLRGGNTNNALYNNRESLLSSLIQQQLAGYGNLIGVGQAGAAGTNAAATNTGNSISTLLGQQGAASASGVLGSAVGYQNMFNNIGKSLGGSGLSGILSSGQYSAIKNPTVDLSNVNIAPLKF